MCADVLVSHRYFEKIADVVQKSRFGPLHSSNVHCILRTQTMSQKEEGRVLAELECQFDGSVVLIWKNHGTMKPESRSQDSSILCDYCRHLLPGPI